MKTLTLSLFVAFIIASALTACNMDRTAVTNTAKTTVPVAAAMQSQAARAAESIDPILGSYVGAFGDNKITLPAFRRDIDARERRLQDRGQRTRRP